MSALAALERLQTEHDSLLRLGEFLESPDPCAWVRKSNVLFDACAAAGMSFDEPDHVAWATQRVTRFLCEVESA